MNFLQHFNIRHELEDYDGVVSSIERGVTFRGTNLWILIFAIFIASLGLNVNSPAVVIGAMLVSPLMGPIMGIGMGMAINDLALLKKALTNFGIAAGVALATSTFFFLISPLNDAHSEILARTSPNIYDVLIAFFGGLAGVFATSSRQKGNVIPGVAIATALMPPLCTAGYGLATLKVEYFFGALYLFIINTVFIAFSTLIVARFLKFPYRHLPDARAEKRASRIIWLVVLITLLPSIYFGYDMVRQNEFSKKAEQFIATAAIFPNDYLLQKNIDADHRSITLTYGGETIEQPAIENLRAKMPAYGLEGAKLEIRQGFAYLRETNNTNEEADRIAKALLEKEQELLVYKGRLDSILSERQLSKQVFQELKVQYPAIESFLLEQSNNHTDSLDQPIWISAIKSRGGLREQDQEKIRKWLQLRIQAKDILFVFD
jgi:uncharacterized hydrophobic protein (TIGR00271 family)